MPNNLDKFDKNMNRAMVVIGVLVIAIFIALLLVAIHFLGKVW